jgi:hypothetical protein
MVMHDFDAWAGEAVTRTNKNITAVRMGCSVVAQYGRRRVGNHEFQWSVGFDVRLRDRSQQGANVKSAPPRNQVEQL